MLKRFLSIVFLCCLVAGVAANVEAVQYRIRDLGTISGNSYANCINNNGQVAGYAFASRDVYHAVTWQNNTLIDLGTLGGVRSVANSINDNGDIVGTVYNSSSGGTSAFIKQNGVTTICGLSASDINNKGQIAGYASASPFGYHANLWEGNTNTDLGTIEGGNYSEAWGINENGDIVGQSYTSSGNYRAFIWQNEEMTALSNLGISSVARSINDNGQVVGYALINGHARAFAWQQGSVSYISGPESYAWDINNKGEIVGLVYLSTTVSHACVWKDGIMLDLGTLGGLNSMALGINESGFICGAAEIADGTRHAVIWEPVPEPSSILTLLCGIGGLSAIIRRNPKKVSS